MKKLIASLSMALITFSSIAETQPVKTSETRPFNLSLTPDVAIYGRNMTIEGMTLSIWGENQQTSFALGLVNGSVGRSAGFSLGILNYSENYKGLQLGLVNYTKQDSFGWQGGLLLGFLVRALGVKL